MENKDKKLNNDHIDNGHTSCGGSGGSMNNAMYRNIHCDGEYHSLSGRVKRRFWDKQNGFPICKRKKFWEL